MKAEPYITKVIFVLKKGLIWSKNNTKNKITIETLNSYVFLIYVAWLSDQRVNDFMQLRLFPWHLNVVHSKWQRKETRCPLRRKRPMWLPGDVFTALKCQPLLLSSPGAELRPCMCGVRATPPGHTASMPKQAPLLSYWLQTHQMVGQTGLTRELSASLSCANVRETCSWTQDATPSGELGGYQRPSSE